MLGGAGQCGREVPGERDLELAGRWLVHRVADGGHRVRFEVGRFAVEFAEDLGGVLVVQGVGAQGAAQSAHDDGCR